MTSWSKLKRRKMVQWTLAYLAGAWVVLEVTSLVGGHFGWPAWIHRAFIVLAAVGLPLAMVLAWFHGEKGRQRVSGPELLIVTALLVVAGASLQLVWDDHAAEKGEMLRLPVADRSVAVLPLDNLSPAEEHAFFGDAMTEEITSALSQVPELTVKSRASASKFAGSGMTLREFARTIGVAYVIEGSVQRSGDRVRVTVQLIDAQTDEHEWTETYDRELTDLFALQVEIARHVADRLAASFTEEERARILASATDDPVAYDLYLQVGASPIGEERGIQLLGLAVERDPDFWPAWEQLARIYLSKERRGEGAKWADSSRAAFRRAIEAADDPATKLRLEAYDVLVFAGDEDEKFARLRAAAEARPSDLTLVNALADLYRIRGRLPESARWGRHAALLDPLQPARWNALFGTYWWVGLYEAAEDALRRAQELDPRWAPVRTGFSWLWMIQGRFEEAHAAIDSAEVLGRPDAPLHRGFVYWWAGDLEKADAAYSAVESSEAGRRRTDLLLPLADVRFALGDSVGGSRSSSASGRSWMPRPSKTTSPSGESFRDSSWRPSKATPPGPSSCFEDTWSAADGTTTGSPKVPFSRSSGRSPPSRRSWKLWDGWWRRCDDRRHGTSRGSPE